MLSNMFKNLVSAGGGAAPTPAPAPYQAYAQPQQPPPTAAPTGSPSALSQLFPTFDLNKASDNNYMSQFRVGGYGGYGGDGGQFVDDSYYQFNGADGKQYRLDPNYTNMGNYTFTASDPLDQHNRFQLEFDKSGNLTSNQNWKDKSWMADNAGILAVLGADAGGYAAFGSGGAGAAAAEGVGNGAFLGEGVASGVPAWDGALSAAQAGGAAAAGGGASVAGGGGGGTGGMSLTGNPIIDKALGSAASSAVSSGIGGLFGGSGSASGNGLGGVLGGAYDYYAQNKAANDMLDWMKSQQGKIDSVYDPNGPVAKAMWDKMSAADAAAGRNSQYGPRSVNFLGQFGGDYAKYTAALTQGLAGNYQSAFNKQATAGTGLATGIGNAIGSGVNSGLSSLFQNQAQNMSSVMDPTSGSGFVGGGVSSGIPAWDQAYQNAYGVDYGEYL